MELQTIKQRFGIIGNSAGLNYALSVAHRVAPTNLTVLITGESGVGKENFSKIIHQYSTRKHNKFIAVNTGAIPEGTIDSELFGHVKGAFTGATENRKGYFETVNGGTIFLDEIAEMPLGTQARLLRVLESGEFIKVGSSDVQKTDVRVIAATNVDLLEKVHQKKFREDLYYRLNTVPIKVPALRERKEDIMLLFRKFTSDFSEKYRTSAIRLTPDAEKLLLNYSWPGNIRELKNLAEQISVLTTEKEVTAEMILQLMPDAGRSNLPVVSSAVGGTMADFTEREIMYKMLFDIKDDLNSLKKFVLGMAENNNYSTSEFPTNGSNEEKALPEAEEPDVELNGGTTQYVIKEKTEEEETIEESLSLADVEKEFIAKALKKHKGKRKDAALDLGISERTLYRKIKEYELDAK